MRRSWLVPVLASLIAVALLVAGGVTWRTMSTRVLGGQCPPNTLCSPGLPVVLSYRSHPLRAELLWGASAVFALLAVGSGLLLWRRPTMASSATI